MSRTLRKCDYFRLISKPGGEKENFYFSLFFFLFFKYLILYPINYIVELAQLQNELNVPAKDEFDIAVQFRVLLHTNL